MKVAIIGSGISGLSAAWALRDSADITVFEKRKRIGGHSCTLDVDYDGTPISVDVGFIVYNAANYPNLIALFQALGVETRPSDMSFAVSNPDGYEWASNPRGLFAWKRNLFDPKFHKFWRTILKFNDLARAELEAGLVRDTTLGAWLDRHGFDRAFRENYILPMGAAIWSTPEGELLEHPALSFFNFFNNHRLMHRERPRWRTVSGGSRSYVTRIEAELGERIRSNSPVQAVTKFGEKTLVKLATGDGEIFDHIIMASHSDQSLALLDNTYADRKTMLGSVHYRPNQIYLHRDTSLMPNRKSAWAAWNVLRQESEDVCLTYWMNVLQGLPKDKPLFVTLNPITPPATEKTFASFEFDHPQFNLASEAAVRELKRSNGDNGLWFAGAWMGSGFHEDGLKSGLEAALSIGGSVPWQAQNIFPKEVSVPVKPEPVLAKLAPPHG